jgi:hypothetical protein
VESEAMADDVAEKRGLGDDQNHLQNISLPTALAFKFVHDSMASFACTGINLSRAGINLSLIDISHC